MTEQDGIIGLDPTRGSGEPGPAGRLAPRPATLSGAVVGLVSNQKARATAFLQAVYQELAGTAALAGQVLVTKDTVSSPPTAEDWRRLHGAAVAITGYGG